MGSPLSPALCLMVVSISEQIWSSTFRHLLSNHHLFIRHIRYVDNRLIFGDKRLTELAPYEVLLDDGFYGKPIILETEPDQEFLGFMLETKPLELIYQGPTNISQVLSPFSASPPTVLLSGFRSRCHIVIKGAFPAFRVQQGLTQLIRFIHSRWVSQGGTPDDFRSTLDSASEPPITVSNRGFPLACPRFDVVSQVVLGFLFFPWFCLFSFSSWFVVRLYVSFFWQLLGSTFARSFLLAVTLLLMDHAQARAFHHHLARALMHLNYLAGLLPFFEPSIEWEDSLPPQSLRLENMRSRSLHTFVPFPPSSASPTLATHGGIPSHMVENPEPNLRPTTLRPPTHMERDHPSTNPVGIRSPVLMSDPNPNPGNPSSITPGREISRTTIPVPVRSKQRVSSTIDPQPKKRQKLSNPPDTPMSMAKDTVTPGPLPIASEAVINALNSDDADGDGASTAASVHDTETHFAHRDESTSHVTIPPGNSAIMLTPNPKAPASPPQRILQPNPMDPPRAPPFRPWTNADDQELMSMKQDTKSRPSWKSIGARLHRDPQVCKLRWGILKQTLGTFDQHGRANPPLEPEAED